MSSSTLPEEEVSPIEPSERFQPVWYGASVLPIAIAPGGDVFVLLGKEKEDQSWRFGSNRWGDFGGRRSPSDADVAETAAREFVEESCAVIADPSLWIRGNGSLLCPRPTEADGGVSNFASDLRAGAFRYCISKCFPSTNDSSDTVNKGSDQANGVSEQSYLSNGNYFTFVCRVPWEPDIPERFLLSVSWLNCLDDAARLYHAVYQDFFGAQVTHLQRISKSLGKNICYKDDSAPLSPVPPLVAGMLNPLMKTADRVSDELSVVSVHLDQGSNTFVVTFAGDCKCFPAKDLQGQRGRVLRHGLLAMRELCAKRNRMRMLLKMMPGHLRNHPALTLFDDRQTGEICWLEVREEYLEKQCVQWWSLPRICELANNGGCFRNEQTRGCFLDVLSAVSQLLRADYEQQRSQ